MHAGGNVVTHGGECSVDARAAMLMLLAAVITLILLPHLTALALAALLLFAFAGFTHKLFMLLRRTRVLLPGSMLIGVLAALASAQQRGEGLQVDAVAFTGGVMVSGRIFLIGCSTLLFILCIPIERVVNAMKRMHLPDTTVTLLWLANSFLKQLQREARGTMMAIRVRGAGRSLPRKLLAASYLSTTFLLRAVGKSERMADVLAARGFRGTLPLQYTSDDEHTGWRMRDSIAVLASLLLFTILMLLS
ncbi:energy-coupling factor transporter transmembrane protein EcfT [bacterium]|nr:energy-coupling factor transporter transmembrane protein EcfT [bacterium]